MADGRDEERCMTQHTDQTKENLNTTEILKRNRVKGQKNTVKVGGRGAGLLSNNIYQDIQLNSADFVLHYLII